MKMPEKPTKTEEPVEAAGADEFEEYDGGKILE